MLTNKTVFCPHCTKPITVKVDGQRRVVQTLDEDATLWFIVVCEGCLGHFQFNNERFDLSTHPYSLPT
jgi:RNase P subunit RPR2